MANTLTPTQVSGQPPTLRRPDAKEVELFKACLDPLKTVCRPALDSEQVVGYFGLLCDLPAEAVFAAASEIAGSRVYTNWPMPGEIRAKAVAIMQPHVTAGEAWRLARLASVAMRDEEVDFIVRGGERFKSADWNRRVLDNLPHAVAATLVIFGGRKLGRGPTVYSQFRDEYERQVGIARRPKMLPPQAAEVIRGFLAKATI